MVGGHQQPVDEPVTERRVVKERVSEELVMLNIVPRMSLYVVHLLRGEPKYRWKVHRLQEIVSQSPYEEQE